MFNAFNVLVTVCGLPGVPHDETVAWCCFACMFFSVPNLFQTNVSDAVCPSMNAQNLRDTIMDGCHRSSSEQSRFMAVQERGECSHPNVLSKI